MADFDALMKGHQMLMSGLGALREGMKRRATGQAISQAQEELNTINQFETDEARKRQQMQLVSQNLAMNMMKAGADPGEVQMSAGMLMPKPLGQTDEFIQQGRMDDLTERQTQRDWQSRENALNRNAQLDIAGIRSTASQNRLKPLTDKHIDELSALEDDTVIGGRLLQEVDANKWLVGPLAGRKPGARGVVDPRFASFNQEVQTWFDSYRAKITGAGASDQELERLKESRPNATDSPSQFMAKINRVMMVAEDIRKRKLKTLEKAGRDVRRFSGEMEQQPEAPAAAPSASTSQAAPTSRMMQFIKKK